MFKTVEEIIAANDKAGQQWFSRGAMEFFETKVEPKVYHGCYFITSEQFTMPPTLKDKGVPDLPRKWTIHVCTPQGWVATMGQFQQYDTFAQAEAAAEGLGSCEEVVTNVKGTEVVIT